MNSAVPNAGAAASAAVGIEDGALEGLKYVALASMLIDHVGRLALGASTESLAFALGRLAFPLFGFVLAVNLARPGDRVGRSERVARRLAFWCLASVVPSVLARGHVWPINVFATLAIGASLCGLAERRLNDVRQVLAAALLIATSFVVEFGVVGVGWIVAVFLWQSRRGAGFAMPVIASGALLAAVNASFGGAMAAVTTFAAVAIVLLGQFWPVRATRRRWLFYGVYPVHLTLIGVWRILS